MRRWTGRHCSCWPTATTRGWTTWRTSATTSTRWSSGEIRSEAQAPAGLDFSPANFAKVAEGFGCLGLRVETPEELGPAMKRAFAHDGPVVVDAVINPHAYTAQLTALRG